jgi:hypothetical protein
MDGFQIAVLGVAIALLIIILAAIGIIMTTNKNNMVFPPSTLPCPNYWQVDADGKCIIPTSPDKINIGSFDKSRYTLTTLPGLDSANNKIDFNNNAWGSKKGGATCAKRDWAKASEILWDGITNYNGCT